SAVPDSPGQRSHSHRTWQLSLRGPGEGNRAEILSALCGSRSQSDGSAVKDLSVVERSQDQRRQHSFADSAARVLTTTRHPLATKMKHPFLIRPKLDNMFWQRTPHHGVLKIK